MLYICLSEIKPTTFLNSRVTKQFQHISDKGNLKADVFLHRSIASNHGYVLEHSSLQFAVELFDDVISMNAFYRPLYELKGIFVAKKRHEIFIFHSYSF